MDNPPLPPSMQSYIFTPIPPLDASLPPLHSREDRLRAIVENLKERQKQVHANITAHATAKIRAHQTSAQFQKPSESTSNDTQQSKNYLDLLLDDADLSPLLENTSKSKNDAPSFELEQVIKAVETMESYDAHFNKVLHTYTSALARLTKNDTSNTSQGDRGSTTDQTPKAPSFVHRRESGLASPRDEAQRRTGSATVQQVPIDSLDRRSSNNASNVPRPDPTIFTSAAPPTAPRAHRNQSMPRADHWLPPSGPRRSSLTWVRDAPPATPARPQTRQEQQSITMQDEGSKRKDSANSNTSQTWQEPQGVTRQNEESRREDSNRDGQSRSKLDNRLVNDVDASRDPRRRGREQK